MNEKIKAYYVADDIDEVLNYIDNLQKENARLKDKFNELKKWINESLKDRICDESYYEAILDVNIKIKELLKEN